MNKKWLFLLPVFLIGCILYGVSNAQLIQKVNEKIAAIQSAQSLVQVDQLQQEARAPIAELNRKGAMSGRSFAITLEREATKARNRIQGIQPPADFSDSESESEDESVVPVAASPSPSSSAQSDDEQRYLADMARAMKESIESYHKSLTRQETSSSSSSSSAAAYRPTRDIFEASAHGDVRAVNYYLDNGIDINAKNSTGSTALHVAARNGQRDVIEILLAAGANIKLKNEQGLSVLQLIERSSIAQNQKEALKHLIENKAVQDACGTDQTCAVCLTEYEEGDAAGVQSCAACLNLLHDECYQGMLRSGPCSIFIRHPQDPQMSIRQEEIVPCPVCREPFSRRILWIKSGFDAQGNALPGHDQFGRPVNARLIAEYANQKIIALSRASTQQEAQELQEELSSLLGGIQEEIIRLAFNSPYSTLYQQMRQLKANIQRDFTRALEAANRRLSTR